MEFYLCTPYSEDVWRSVGTLSLGYLSYYRYQSYGLIDGCILISTQILLLKEQNSFTLNNLM